MNAAEAKQIALNYRDSNVSLQMSDIKLHIKAAAIAGKFSCEYNRNILPENAIKLAEEGYVVINNISTKFFDRITWD